MLKGKFVVINRAPIMMAWSFLVAERMGFQREEALSIGTFPFHSPTHLALIGTMLIPVSLPAQPPSIRR